MPRTFWMFTVKTTSSGTPTEVLIEENSTVADIVKKAQADISKNDATIDGVVVDPDFVPQGDSEIILQPRKYSSGAAF